MANYYVCSKCQKPCDVWQIKSNEWSPGTIVLVDMSRCCSVPATVKS